MLGRLASRLLPVSSGSTGAVSLLPLSSRSLMSAAMSVSRVVVVTRPLSALFAVSAEEGMENVLKEELKAAFVRVRDISGGCGAMYEVEVDSPVLQGESLVAQRKLVKNALEPEIKNMHGITIKTKIAS
eukprot:EC795354.1.p2 GENE.EC795354.1~~EC795354.1.p2  ORF type:complete len:129 (+),score=36.71 EC795354.1:49-435(+)